MGNCLSKSPNNIRIGKLMGRYSASRGTGPKAELRAGSIGLKIKNSLVILTPVEDRFPPQACQLEIDSCFGYVSRGCSIKRATKMCSPLCSGR